MINAIVAFILKWIFTTEHMNAFMAWVSSWFNRTFIRPKQQQEAMKRVEEDIGKPRDEETRKNEEDLFNS